MAPSHNKAKIAASASDPLSPTATSSRDSDSASVLRRMAFSDPPPPTAASSRDSDSARGLRRMTTEDVAAALANDAPIPSSVIDAQAAGLHAFEPLQEVQSIASCEYILGPAGDTRHTTHATRMLKRLSTDDVVFATKGGSPLPKGTIEEQKKRMKMFEEQKKIMKEEEENCKDLY
jgi:hypothetical protein